MRFNNENLKKKVLNAPLLPGCYIYRDAQGKILYIGKALNLNDRVKNYFNPVNDPGPRIRLMISKIADVEFVIADSEAEALALETNLIKKYKPKFNVEKKDDKSYQLLRIDLKEDFPRPELVRLKKDDGAKYYGPYPDGMPVKRILKLLRTVFPYRTCNRKITEFKSSDSKPCLYYFLGLCSAPCAGFISKENYRHQIKDLMLYFEDQQARLIGKLRQDMYTFAEKQEFESAAALRDKINDLIYIAQKVQVNPDMDEKRFVVFKGRQKAQALAQLMQAAGLEKIELHDNFKIECYDISNLSGKNAVGSMVVFLDGNPARKLYRKFRIKGKDTPDDFAMLQEVFSRRFKHSKPDPSFDVWPDLIIVDGGKGQLSSVYKVMLELGVTIPVAGLAKRNEDLFLIDESSGELSFTKKILAHGSEARFLVQRIRDEAHRFGITYHRSLRLKAQKFSVLNEIPGVGAVIGTKLLKAFGSLDGIRKATEAELLTVVKNRKTVTNIIKLLGKTQ